MSDNGRVVIMVEGNLDENFINQIVKPILLKQNRYKDILTYKYSARTKIENTKFIDAIKAIEDDIYCLGDIDSSPCITGKKQKLKMDKIGNFLEDHIFVVVKEIEGWLMAGTDRKRCKKLNVKFHEKTDNLSKEDCHTIIAKSKYQPRLHCINEMLKEYNIALAIERNKSFGYFYNHFLQS